ncbi:hypothetical protein LCGC14_0282230 [marine sediment metagenome]|uniref:Uncharacterized protein n=1 Tax=marine sediment metagenome TaxID=412755 RepID=A0A0F9U0G3_9ZZZZ
MKTMTQNRAYRLTQDMETPSDIKPSLGDVVYCDHIDSRNGKARLVFVHNGTDLYRIVFAIADCCKALVLAKFVTLPSQIRHRFNINDEGQRVRFTKDLIYCTHQAGGKLPPGTRLKCIVGGDKPWFSYIDSSNRAQPIEFLRCDRVHLCEVDPIEDETSRIVVSLPYTANATPGCRLVFNGKITFENHELGVERKTVNSKIACTDFTAGALQRIGAFLRQDLTESGINLVVNDDQLIESFINYTYFEKGVMSFALAYSRIVLFFKDDEVFRSNRETQRFQTKTQTILPKSQNTTYRQLMHAQYRW